MSWHVYRLYDQQDRLLYIGCTSQSPERRTTQHRRTQPWGREISHQSAEDYADETSARQAEMDAIEAERPHYNRRAGHLPIPYAVDDQALDRALDALLGTRRAADVDEMRLALMSYVARREEEIKRVGLIIEALYCSGMSWRSMQGVTGIPHSTLRDWRKKAAL